MTHLILLFAYCEPVYVPISLLTIIYKIQHMLKTSVSDYTKLVYSNF